MRFDCIKFGLFWSSALILAMFTFIGFAMVYAIDQKKICESAGGVFSNGRGGAICFRSDVVIDLKR